MCATVHNGHAQAVQRGSTAPSADGRVRGVHRLAPTRLEPTERCADVRAARISAPNGKVDGRVSTRGPAAAVPDAAGVQRVRVRASPTPTLPYAESRASVRTRKPQSLPGSRVPPASPPTSAAPTPAPTATTTLVVRLPQLGTRPHDVVSSTRSAGVSNTGRTAKDVCTGANSSSSSSTSAAAAILLCRVGHRPPRCGGHGTASTVLRHPGTPPRTKEAIR